MTPDSGEQIATPNTDEGEHQRTRHQERDSEIIGVKRSHTHRHRLSSSSSSLLLLQARHGDLTGWLPTDYVQKIESELDSNSNSSSAAAGSNSVAVAAEPIQVSKPVNSREIQLAENISPMKPAASTAVAPTATSNSNPSASAGLSEQLSQLIVNSGGVVTSSSSSAPNPNPNAKICASCHEPIKSAFVMAKEKPFHPNHFQVRNKNIHMAHQLANIEKRRGKRHKRILPTICPPSGSLLALQPTLFYLFFISFCLCASVSLVSKSWVVVLIWRRMINFIVNKIITQHSIRNGEVTLNGEQRQRNHSEYIFQRPLWSFEAEL